MAELIIETQNLCKSYSTGWFKPPVDAVNELDLKVEPGRVYGLLGPNGAGKTTTIKMLLGLARPTSGSGKMLGLDIRQRACRREVGYLPENQQFPRYMTAFVALENFGGLAGMSRPERRKRCDGALAEVGLSDWKHVSVAKFSKGMKQRLGLALAMFHDPKLLILDEPTDGVDPQGRKDIRHIIERKKNEGKTVLINSHILQEVELVADEVTILNKGNVAHQGNVAQLTGDSARYRLRVAEMPAESRKRLDFLSDDPEAPDHFFFKASDEAALDRCVDRLRAEKVSIRALIPTRKTLEDVFLEIVHQEA